MFWYLTWHEKFLQAPWYNVLQHKILWFRFVSVSAESFGQIFSFGFGIGPKPKRWFRSYTSMYHYFIAVCRLFWTLLVLLRNMDEFLISEVAIPDKWQHRSHIKVKGVEIVQKNQQTICWAIKNSGGRGFICTFSLLISLSITLWSSKFRNKFTVSSKCFDTVCYLKRETYFGPISFEVHRNGIWTNNIQSFEMPF